MVKYIGAVIFLLAGICQASRAQEPTIVKDSLYSAVLQEQRKIEIIYPRGYDPKAPEKYEVLYCLEGIYAFVPMEHNFLAAEGFIPNLIIVGIPNTEKNGVSLRDRDFTPTHTYGETGGADNFLQFLKTELLPYMEKNYPVKPSGHTLYGGSLSGLFAVYAFLKEPTLFTSYLTVEASLWWDNFYIGRSSAQLMAKFGKLNNTLWLGGRDGSPFQFMGIAQMDSILTANNIPGLVWKRQLYPNETHFSSQFKGLWDGLKFSYGGFYASKRGYSTSRKIMIKPQRGEVVKGKSFPLICYNLADSPYIRYTTDGTIPTSTSPSLTGEKTYLSLNKTTLVKLKTFSVRAEYNQNDSALFTLSQVCKPVATPAGLKGGGLKYAYYEGDFDTIPVLATHTPTRSGIADKDLDLSAFPAQTGYVLAMDGYIKIDQPGYYIFESGAEKNYRTFLNGRQILGNHIIPGAGQSYMVPLEKGFYALRMEYLHPKNGESLQPLYLKTEHAEDFPVPASMLYSR